MKSHFLIFDSTESTRDIKEESIKILNEMTENKHMIIPEGCSTKIAEKLMNNILTRTKSEYIFIENKIEEIPHLQVFFYNSVEDGSINTDQYFKQYSLSRLNKIKINTEEKSLDHIVKIILKSLNDTYQKKKNEK